jgi:GMP synthase (glutamine-hydrolysing)
MKSALVLRHLAFEDLGRLQSVLVRAGYEIRYIEGGVDPLSEYPPLEADLLVVLGGPIAVYDIEDYPWLAEEINWVRKRLMEDRPTLGICLGAQLMAAALGAKVYPGGKKEIGWGPLQRGRASAGLPGMDEYIERAGAILHWHGDTYDLPKGARHLASTAVYENQAFAWGKNCLAFQFHAEFDARKLEQWLIGHCMEIAAAPGVSLKQVREDTKKYSEQSQAAGDKFFAGWLASLTP